MKSIRYQWRRLCWGVAAALLTMSLAQAQSLPKPKGPVILMVSGHISVHNSGDLAVFDADMLNAMPVREFTTRTPWVDKPAIFSGPSIQTVLNKVGAQGKLLRLAALDKYEATIPMDDVTRFDPLLALRVDGKALTIRTQGPVLVMYPYDKYPEIKTELYSGRTVWQLQHIVVE